MFFFFSGRRLHTRCSRDWSSDVCSSDIARARGTRLQGRVRGAARSRAHCGSRPRIRAPRKDREPGRGRGDREAAPREVRRDSDRKSVGEGKSGEIGGGGIFKEKNKKVLR